MRLTLKFKLTLIICTALTAIAVVVGGAYSGIYQAQDLAVIEGRLIPRLRSGPEIRGDYERLRQQMRDALAAQDPAALEATIPQRERTLQLISDAAPTLEQGEAGVLQRALQDYWVSAYGISRRMIAGEAGDALVHDIESMQSRDRRAVDVLDRVLSVGETELRQSFEAMRQLAAEAARFRLAIGFRGIPLALALFFWLIRGILQSLTALSQGFARFATGAFDEKIQVLERDELADVACEANQMAFSLERFLCRNIGAVRGAFHQTSEADTLQRVSGFALGDAEAQALAKSRSPITFQVGQGLEVKPVDVAESVKAVLTILGHRLRDRVEVELQLRGPPQIECYSRPLNQALMNRVATAIEAMPNGGKLLIASEADEEHCCLRVVDNGQRIPNEVRDRVFERFFSNKPVGKSTGLGLAISYSIVRKHQGSLELKSAVPRGTEALIRIPVHSRSVTDGSR